MMDIQHGVNAYEIMGAVDQLLRKTGRRDELPGIRGRMMSGDYENLCAVAEEVSYGTIKIVRPDRDDEEEEE